MKTHTSNLLLRSAAAPLFLLASTALAQKQEQPLPAAPSSVLQAEQRAQLDEALGKPAGSGLRFTAPSIQPFSNDIAIENASAQPLRLSLDDAISLALERNVRLRYDRANQESVRGLTLSVINALLPNVSVKASSNAQEVNLAAQGFKPSLFAKFASTGLIPAGFTIPTIVKVNVTQASANLNQVLFNLTDFELFRGTTNEKAVVDLQLLSDRGDAVITVGAQYLTVLADQANLANTQAQVDAAKTLYDQAVAKHDAGVGIKLDVLRARVQFQQRQQDLAAAQGQLGKDRIQLARICGLPAGQAIELTDAAPFRQLDMMDLAAARTTAYQHRKDLLSLQQQIILNGRILRAVKYQRLPTLGINGYYGVIGITGGSYHGDFSAAASLKFPIFKEAAQRGQQQSAEAQLSALHQQESSLRATIDAQIRGAMLDVVSTEELARVAQSNVTLAQQELSDETDRFKAGVDDNLPVVDAQATVASAEAQLVQSLFQYNVAKLTLARYTGVVETRYRTYLGQ